MGYSTTFTNLRNEVISIVDSDNPEFIANLDKIIARAQDNVQRDLDLEMWRTFVAVSLTSGNRLFTRPSTWLKVFSFHFVDTGLPLEKRTLDYLRAYGTTPGTPKFWAERDETNFQVAPIPSANVNIEAEVLTRLASLSNSNPENWISRNAADLLLLQTLIGSETYLLGEERVAGFAQMYQILLSSAHAELRGTQKNEDTPIRSVPRPNVEAA
jgi:hypothetical protein